MKFARTKQDRVPFDWIHGRMYYVDCSCTHDALFAMMLAFGPPPRREGSIEREAPTADPIEGFTHRAFSSVRMFR